jgi:general secretion pathway protein L
MTKKIIVRWLKQNDKKLEWLLVDNRQPKELQQGTLQDLAKSAENQSVILLLPASEVLLLGLALPVKRNSQIKKALPFALEDLLVDEVEAYHSVWHKQPDGKVYVALTNHDKFKVCLASFEDAGITIDSVYPESLCLPYQEHSCALVIDGQQAIIRHEKYIGAGFDCDMLPIFLDKVLVENSALNIINSWSVDELSLDSQEHIIDINHHKVDSILPFLATGVATLDSACNLLSGSFEKQHKSAWQGKKWLPSIGLIVFTALLQMGFLVYHYSQKKSELAVLETQTQNLFKQTFPEVKRIVNIKVQADQALMELRKNTNSKGSSFMSLLYETGEVLNANVGYKLKQLDFLNDQLQIQLTIPDISQVDQIKQQLEAGQQLLVKIKSEEANQDGVEVHFEIKHK